MKKIFDTLMAKSERESWDERTDVKYTILIPKTIKVNHGNGLTTNKEEWFRFERIEQSKDFPHGITEKEALGFAGKSGKVWKTTSKIQRLK